MPRRAVADDQALILDLALGQRVDRVGKNVEAFFHHQPAEEGDRRLIILDADASGAMPCLGDRD